jgi:hypothetical protein
VTPPREHRSGLDRRSGFDRRRGRPPVGDEPLQCRFGVPEAGHGMHRDNATFYNQAVLGFLQRR